MSNIISTCLLIASVGVFFGYINPTYGAQTGKTELKEKSIRELRDESVQYSDALEKTREIEKVRTGLLEKYNGIPIEERERIEKLLPDHIDSVRLIIDVNNIASQYGMTLKNIGLTGSETTKPVEGTSGAIGPKTERIKSVELKFNVSGAYDDFRSFIKDLERSLRLVDVISVSFIANDTSSAYSVALSTYHLNFNTK